MNIIDKLEMEQLKKDIPIFRAGDTLKVHVKITEGDKQRIQVYQGVCIKRVNSGLGSSYTVRKISGSIGVERIFPLHSPNIDKIEVLRLGKVRRASFTICAICVVRLPGSPKSVLPDSQVLGRISPRQLSGAFFFFWITDGEPGTISRAGTLDTLL